MNLFSKRKNKYYLPTWKFNTVYVFYEKSSSVFAKPSSLEREKMMEGGEREMDRRDVGR